MKMKKVSWLIVFTMLAAGWTAPALAADASLSAGAKSLLIPGWGQYQNGEFDSREGKMKVGAMAVIEVAAIITTGVVGGVAGYPQVWVGIGLFIANHVWSALDAFVNAQEDPGVNLGTEPGDRIAVAR
jgi:hypothetical protein